MTTEPLSRTSALADSGACNRPGASSVSSTGMFCRSSGGGGRRRLDVEFERMPAGARAAGDPDLAIGADNGVGVDALDAVFDAVAQIGKHHRAVGHRDALDRGRIGIGLARRSRGRSEKRGFGAAMRSRSSGTLSTGRMIASSVISGWPDHTLAKRHVGLDAADGQAIAGVAVLRLLERDVVQRHVQGRPQADPGRARDRQPVSGFALDPVLDRRGQEARGDADDQQQRAITMMAAMAAPAIFKALMSIFQTG